MPARLINSFPRPVGGMSQSIEPTKEAASGLQGWNSTNLRQVAVQRRIFPRFDKGRNARTVKKIYKYWWPNARAGQTSAPAAPPPQSTQVKTIVHALGNAA